MTTAIDILGDLTDAFSAEKHTTTSVICLLINHHTKEILKEIDIYTSYLIQMKCMIKVDLKSR